MGHSMYQRNGQAPLTWLWFRLDQISGNYININNSKNNWPLLSTTTKGTIFKNVPRSETDRITAIISNVNNNNKWNKDSQWTTIRNLWLTIGGNPLEAMHITSPESIWRTGRRTSEVPLKLDPGKNSYFDFKNLFFESDRESRVEVSFQNNNVKFM